MAEHDDFTGEYDAMDRTPSLPYEAMGKDAVGAFWSFVTLGLFGICVTVALIFEHWYRN